MMRFQTLLEPSATSTPKQDQDRASQGLATAVAGSHLRWWTRGGERPAGRYLLLAIAPYSQYDLTLLDLIEESFESGTNPPISVYVTDLMEYATQEDLRTDFPDITQVFQPPVVTLVEPGKPNKSASGPAGRDLTAQ